VLHAHTPGRHQNRRGTRSTRTKNEKTPEQRSSDSANQAPGAGARVALTTLGRVAGPRLAFDHVAVRRAVGSAVSHLGYSESDEGRTAAGDEQARPHRAVTLGGRDGWWLLPCPVDRVSYGACRRDDGQQQSNGDGNEVTKHGSSGLVMFLSRNATASRVSFRLSRATS